MINRQIFLNRTRNNKRMTFFVAIAAVYVVFVQISEFVCFIQSNEESLYFIRAREKNEKFFR